MRKENGDMELVKFDESCPSSASMVEVGSYMVALYRPCEKVVDASGNAVREVKCGIVWWYMVYYLC